MTSTHECKLIIGIYMIFISINSTKMYLKGLSPVEFAKPHTV